MSQPLARQTKAGTFYLMTLLLVPRQRLTYQQMGKSTRGDRRPIREAKTRVALSKFLRISALLVLLTAPLGCVAIPTGEYAESKPDIRTVAGDKNSERPIRPGTSKEQVIALLGDPQFTSPDGNVVVFRRVMGKGYGAVLPPLYFAAGPLHERTYYLRVVFADDVVSKWTLGRDAQFEDANMGYQSMSVDGPYSSHRGAGVGDEIVAQSP